MFMLLLSHYFAGNETHVHLMTILVHFAFYCYRPYTLLCDVVAAAVTWRGYFLLKYYTWSSLCDV